MLQLYNPHTSQSNQTHLVHNLTQKTKPDHGQLFTVGTSSILVSPMLSEFVKSENTDEEPRYYF